ncbi:hypothetical protein GCM10007904_00840 [Oharaeibacter diazotrophicus]|nr:hypothetical protein GCM10007904_00840 [Oharaeibacter diazotrophicus]
MFRVRLPKLVCGRVVVVVEAPVSDDPLTGIAAGAMPVGYAFDRVRGIADGLPVDVSIWGSA